MHQCHQWQQKNQFILCLRPHNGHMGKTCRLPSYSNACHLYFKYTAPVWIVPLNLCHCKTILDVNILMLVWVTFAFLFLSKKLVWLADQDHMTTQWLPCKLIQFLNKWKNTGVFVIHYFLVMSHQPILQEQYDGNLLLSYRDISKLRFTSKPLISHSFHFPLMFSPCRPHPLCCLA